MSGANEKEKRAGRETGGEKGVPRRNGKNTIKR